MYFFEMMKASGYTESMAEKDMLKCSQETGCDYDLIDVVMRNAWYNGDRLIDAAEFACNVVPEDPEMVRWILSRS